MGLLVKKAQNRAMNEPVYRPRASVVCVHDGKLLVLRAADPSTGREYLLVPGGAIEEGESPLAAAERETLEETGCVVLAQAATERVERYTFDWDGKVYDCKTWFYSATLRDPGAARGKGLDAPYLLGVEWIDLDQVSAAMAYHPVIQQVVCDMLGEWRREREI